MSEYIEKFMIDALKRNPQCEDVSRCLVFKEIQILYITRTNVSKSHVIKVLSSPEEEEEEEEEEQEQEQEEEEQRGALLEPAFATRRG